MTLRYSTGARAFMASIGSLADAFNNGRIEFYTGPQPASANDAVTGTLLCTITKDSAAHTREVRPSWNLTLAGDATVPGNHIEGIRLGGALTMKFDRVSGVAGQTLEQFIDRVVASINSRRGALRLSAKKASATQITITAAPGWGEAPNMQLVGAGITSVDVAPATALVTPVNGLQFGPAAANVLAKKAEQNWTGVNVAAGDAGWYRFYGSTADTGAVDATGTMIREDGAIGLAAAELNMTSIALAMNATTTLSSWERTLPLSA